MRGSFSDRSSSSLEDHSDQIIKRARKKRQLGKSQKREKRKRGSTPSTNNDGRRSDGQGGVEEIINVDPETKTGNAAEEPQVDSATELVMEPVEPYISSDENKISQLSAIYDTPRLSTTQHRLVPRSSGSSNGPLIIGTTVGGVSFIGILIIVIVIWRRRLRAKERQFAGHNQSAGGPRGTLSVITAPSPLNHDEDKLADLGMVYRSPMSTYGTGASRSSSINARSRSTPTSPIDKSQIRHHSWTQDDNILGSPTPPAITQVGGRVPPRATTPMSVVSSPSKKAKRSSSILQRFGSRDLSAPASLQTLASNRGPPPPRPPRPDEVGADDGESSQPQVFELSASPSVKRKRNSKPLPVLPTFLVREHEEEMKRRKTEWEKEKRDQYEKMRRPQSPVDDQSKKSTPPPPGSSSTFAGASNNTGIRSPKSEQRGLKKVMSLDSLASTTTSSSSSSADEDETPGGTRIPTPEVNALSPRSSQRRPERRTSELRPPIPSFANTYTDMESVATGSDSLMKRTSYLIADGSSGVEATAVAPGFPSPKLAGKLRLTPPLPSSASAHSSSNSSSLNPIQAPVSATVAKPPLFPLSPQLPEESSGAHTRTESTSSGGVATAGEHQASLRTFMLADNPSDRALVFSSIEDWRESVGETYAATRPTTAGAASMGQGSAEDISGSSAVIPLRPAFPRRISVDTGVGIMRSPPPPVASGSGSGGGGGAFLTPSTATTASLSPYTPIERVPVSAVTPPSNDKLKDRETLRPSTPEQTKEAKKNAEKASRVLKRKSVPRTAQAVDQTGAKSWLDVGNDSDAES